MSRQSRRPPPKRLPPPSTNPSSKIPQRPPHPYALPETPHATPTECPAFYFLNTALALHSVRPTMPKSRSEYFEEATEGPEKKEDLCNGRGVVYDDADAADVEDAIRLHAPTHSMAHSGTASPVRSHQTSPSSLSSSTRRRSTSSSSSNRRRSTSAWSHSESGARTTPHTSGAAPTPELAKERLKPLETAS